jgi:DNA-binding winged helix-turn-helix (wHTH) protein/TolB-like protein/tetratricopeptide (TPR) repeat protein
MTEQAYQFDNIQVEPSAFKVLRAGENVVLEPKTFLLLMFLIENRTRLVEKREILDVIWKDVAVTENALTREVGKLRKSLGDDPKTSRYIQTVHTRGYRFIAPVQIIDRGSVDSTKSVAIPLPPGDAPHGFRRLLRPKLLAALGAIILLAAGGLFLKRNVVAANNTWATKKTASTLAVLPFQSIGAGPNDPYVGLAIADALITKLSGSPRLAVQPTSTIIRYSDAKLDSLAKGRTMKVDYVLEGRIQSQGDRMRVTVQLLCVSCEKSSRWAGTFDEKSEDIFHIEDSISEKVVSALTLELTGEEYKRMRKRATSNQEAHVAFAKGMVLMFRDTKEDLDKTIEFFELAVERDPQYAAAWAQLSDSYRRREWYGAAPSEVMAKSRAAALKAVALDPDLCYGHSMLGFIAFQYDWTFDQAEREYKRALELQPSFVHQWYARLLLATNRGADAEFEYRRFLSKAMPQPVGGTNAGQFQFLTRHFDRAIAQFRETLDLDPNFPPAHEMLGLVYEQQGRTDLALQELQKAVELSRGYVGLGALGHLYATLGRSADVQKVLQDLAAQSRHRYVGPFEMAVIHAGLRQNRNALDDLEKAYTERSLSAQSLRFDPRLTNLRNEPRFHEFVRRIGLPF